MPEPGSAGEPERAGEAAVTEAAGLVDEHMRKTEPHRALEAIFRGVDATNRYLELREPWKAAKDPALAGQVGTTLYTCCEALRITALLLSPFLPEKSAEILARLGLAGALERARLPGDARWGGIATDAATTTGDPLFPRVETEPA